MGVFYIIFENLLNAQLVIEQISKLQQDIQRKLLRMRKDARLIIFIDDIDRLTPEESIDLLIGIYNLTSFKKCIFVLTADMNIIKKGIEIKYKDYPEDKKKLFLDKLIQVPYILPMMIYLICLFYLFLSNKILMNFVH